jgi:hypothetical protein
VRSVSICTFVRVGIAAAKSRWMQSNSGLRRRLNALAKRDGCVGGFASVWEAQKTPRSVPSVCSRGIAAHHRPDPCVRAAGSRVCRLLHPNESTHCVSGSAVKSPDWPHALNLPSSRQIPFKSPIKPLARATYDVKSESARDADCVAALNR